MKMVSIIDAVFWGVVLIALGVWLIVRRYVPVQVPLGRILVALVFVYLGVRILAHGPWAPPVQTGTTTVFSESTVRGTPGHDDYNVIFGTSQIDLTGLPAAGGDKEVNVVFGSATMRVDPRQPVLVRMSAAFGTVEAPGVTVSFGDREWRSPSYREGAPALRIKANAVFGRLAIVP
jgi:hypothetical protein